MAMKVSGACSNGVPEEGYLHQIRATELGATTRERREDIAGQARHEDKRCSKQHLASIRASQTEGSGETREGQQWGRGRQ